MLHIIPSNLKHFQNISHVTNWRHGNSEDIVIFVRRPLISGASKVVFVMQAFEEHYNIQFNFQIPFRSAAIS